MENLGYVDTRTMHTLFLDVFVFGKLHVIDNRIDFEQLVSFKRWFLYNAEKLMQV